jgi:hypothetical protein
LRNLGGRTEWRNGWERGARRTSPNTEHGKASDQFPHRAANRYNHGSAHQYNISAANWSDNGRRGSRLKFHNDHDHAGNQRSTIGEHSAHAGDNARRFALRNCPRNGFDSRQHFAEQSEFALNVILTSGKRSSKCRDDIALRSALPANGWQRHISEVEI